jgi:hypothetical protein
VSYATAADVAAFLGIAEEALPADIARSLDRASEEVDTICLPNVIDITDTYQAAAARSAVCGLCEYWINNGTAAAAGGEITGYQIGVTRINYSKGVSASGIETQDMRRVYQPLLKAGLLYRGVSSI